MSAAGPDRLAQGKQGQQGTHGTQGTDSSGGSAIRDAASAGALLRTTLPRLQRATASGISASTALGDHSLTKKPASGNTGRFFYALFNTIDVWYAESRDS